MKDIRHIIRRESRPPVRGVKASDAAPKTPAKAELAVDVKLTSKTADTDHRNRLWESFGTVSNVFADFRRVLPNAGASLWGRILKWLELRCFVESVDYQVGSDIVIDPRKANNTIIIADADVSLIFPLSYTEGGGEAALPRVSEIEDQLSEAFSRAILTPHTIWLFHGGNSLISVGAAIMPEGEILPEDTAGMTLISCAHLVHPGGVSKWRILGMKHYAS